MPYRRRFKKSFRRKRTMKRKRTSSKRIYRIAKRAARNVGELKFQDIGNSGALWTPSWTGDLEELCDNIAQTIGQTNRIGSAIRLKGIRLAFRITGNDAHPRPTSTVRILLVRGHAENGVPLTWTDINQEIGNSSAVMSAKRFNRYKKSTVYYDKTFQVGSGWLTIPGLGNPPTVPSISDRITRKTYIPLNYDVRYDVLATTLIMDGGLYIMAISDNLDISRAEVLWNVRLYFHDQ